MATPNIADTLSAFEHGGVRKGKRTPVIGPEKAVAYLRCSTEDQELGIAAQEASIRAYATQQSIQIVALLKDEGVSGATPLDKREGFQLALGQMTSRDATVLLVAKRDRLARDTLAAAFLQRLVERIGGRVECADGVGNGDDPLSKMQRGMMDLIAEYERSLIRNRTKAALAVKKARGERIGGIPYGFAVGADKKLVPVPAEQEAIRHIMRLREDGESWDCVVHELIAERRPARGKTWYATTAARIFKAEKIRRDAKT